MLDGPVQLAYAVADVRRAATDWAARGVGPFFVLEHIALREVRVRGVTGSFDHSSAYSWWGSVMVELICQHDGGADPIVPTAGLHHVAFFVDDVDDAADRLVAQGHDEVLHAETTAGTPFAFHDARPTLGHLIEIYEPTNRLRGFYDMVRSAAADWDGTHPIRPL